MQSSLEESILEYPPYRFLISKVPNDTTIGEFKRILKENKVSIVIRACESSYDVESLENTGIQVLDFNFPDGSGPPKPILERWLKILHEMYIEHAKENEGKTIALHCVAGLGRAPVMVGIALIEAGMAPADTVEFIRKRRKGALNATQLKYLLKYKKKSSKDCIIS